MTPADIHKLYAAAIGAILLVGGLAWWRHDVGQKAIQAYELRSLDSTKTKQLDSVAQRSQDAVQAASQAQAQKAQALRLVAAGEALRAKQDSTVRQSANARAEAEKMVTDSQATLAELRAGLDRLVLQSRVDSASASHQRLADSLSIRSLLQAVAAGDSASQASAAQVRALVALNATLTREVGLLKKAQPGFVSNHLGAGVGYGCGVKGCEPVAAVIVRVLP